MFSFSERKKAFMKRIKTVYDLRGFWQEKLHGDEFMQRKNVKDQVKPDDDCETL